MGFPNREFSLNIENQIPEDGEIPEFLYYVFYKNIKSEWTLSTHSFYKEHALQHASLLNRPSKIITYSHYTDERVKRVRKVKP